MNKLILSPERTRLALTSRDSVNAYTRLVSEDDCRTAIAMFGTRSRPVGIRKGAELASQLVGAYPSKGNMADPEIYAYAIATVFGEHGLNVGQLAVDQLTRTNKFLPTRSEVVEALDKIESEFLRIAYMARQHLAEHKRRREDSERQELLRNERAKGR